MATRSGPGWQVNDNTPQFLRAAETAVERAVAKSAIRVEDEAERLVNQHSSLGGLPRSKPGEPPYRETGKLLFEIGSETFQEGRDFVGRVGTNLKYGLYLEVGTRKMAKRPYLRPALDNKARQIVADLRAAGARLTAATPAAAPPAAAPPAAAPPAVGPFGDRPGRDPFGGLGETNFLRDEGEV